MSAALASRPEPLAQFGVEPARNPFAVQTLVVCLRPALSNGYVLEAIARA